jgi:rhodanese-related sulfurtransferase
MKTMNPAEAARLLAAGGGKLIDVRTPAEFSAVHAQGSHNIPLAHLDPASVHAEVAPGESVFCICRSGMRSGVAIAKLHAAGVPNVVNIAGGIDAWVRAGLPVSRG